MKKTLLATAILTGLVSATAGAATVYDKDGTTLKVGGRAEVRGLISDSVDGTMKDKSRARINFKGQTQITEDLTGFGVMEYEINNGSSVEVEDTDGEEQDVYNSIKTRYLYAGLSTVAGDFSYGRQDTAGVQVSDLTDIASTHSGIQQVIDAASDKENNTFLYAGEFAGVSVQANFIASAEDDQDAYGISALYSTDAGVDFAAAYSDQDEENQASFGAAYTLNDLYLAATYALGDTSADTEFTSLEIAAQYKVTKELRMIGIYGLAEEETAGVTTDTEDFVALEGQYRFNKSLRTYASYKVNNLQDKDDELVLGLRYNF